MKKLPRVAFVLFAFVALVFVADLIRERIAGATAQPSTQDQKICTGTAAPTGGTFTCDYAVPSDKALHITADVGFSALDAGHLWGSASISCNADFENQNGSVSMPTPVTTTGNTAVNPMAAIGTSTTTKYANFSRSESTDPVFGSVGAGTSPTCTWSVSSTNARLTVTNNATTTTADVTAWVHVFVFGSQ